jgi:hypothetical protein
MNVRVPRLFNKDEPWSAESERTFALTVLPADPAITDTSGSTKAGRLM